MLSGAIVLTWTATLIATLAAGDHAFDRMLALGGTWRGTAWSGEWWRLVTAGFVEVPSLWAVWNLAFGFIWLSEFEREQGRARLLVVVLAGGACAAATVIASTDVLVVGSSGQVWGVIGGLVVERVWRLGFKAYWAVRRYAGQTVLIVLWLLLHLMDVLPWAQSIVPLLSGAAVTFAVLSRRAWSIALTVVAHAALITLAVVPVTPAQREWLRLYEIKVALSRDEFQAVLSGIPTVDDPNLELRVAALRGLGRSDDVLEELRACVASNPVRFECRTALIRELRSVNRLTEALELTQAFPSLERDRIEILMGLGRDEEARAVFKLAEGRLSPEHSRLFRCSFALADGNTTDVRNACLQIRDTDAWWAASLRIQASVLNGNCEGALELLGDRQPSPWEHKLTVVCMLRAGELQSARAAIGAHPTDPELRLLEFALKRRSGETLAPTDQLVRDARGSMLLPLLEPDVREALSAVGN